MMYYTIYHSMALIDLPQRVMCLIGVWMISLNSCLDSTPDNSRLAYTAISIISTLLVDLYHLAGPDIPFHAYR